MGKRKDQGVFHPRLPCSICLQHLGVLDPRQAGSSRRVLGLNRTLDADCDRTRTCQRREKYSQGQEGVEQIRFNHLSTSTIPCKIVGDSSGGIWPRTYIERTLYLWRTLRMTRPRLQIVERIANFIHQSFRVALRAGARRISSTVVKADWHA